MTGPQFLSSGAGRHQFTDEEREIIAGNVADGVSDGYGVRSLAAALLSDALDSAINGRGRHQLEDLIWVASAAATPWFDAANVDQRAALELCGWAYRARNAIENGRGSRRERRLLSEGVDVIADGPDPAYVPPTTTSKALAKERKASLRRQKKRRKKKR